MAGSKTARRSTPSTGKMTDEMRVKEASRAPAARLISLANGRFCYFQQPIANKQVRINPNSDAFIEIIRPACELGMAERLHQEIAAFASAAPASAWPAVLARVIESGVLDKPEA